MKKIFLLIFICAFFNGYLFAQTYNITTNNDIRKFFIDIDSLYKDQWENRKDYCKFVEC